MTVSIDYGNTNIIDVELSDLTLVSGTIYTFDTNAFRLTLKDIEDGVVGMAFPKTHNHNTEVAIAGVVFSRTLEILNPYSVRFPDLQITVILEGSNNNVFDVQGGILVQNQAQIVANNSAGLQTVSIGSGLSSAEQDQLALAASIAEADTFFDKSEGLLHFYYRGTATDIIPAKNVSGEQVPDDSAIVQ